MIEVTLLMMYTVLGLAAGILIGLLPGLGVSTTFLLLTPFLITISPIYSLFFFVSLLATSQYFGSITALVFGVPGELSSYPVIKERPHLLGQIDNVLRQTALGSFIGSMIALLLFVLLLYSGSLWVYLYNYRIFSWVLGLAVLATVFFGGTGRYLTNALLFVAGVLLAKIGYDRNYGQTWGTFGISDLTTGIPLAAVAMGLLVVPSIMATVTSATLESLNQQFKPTVTHWGSIIRGSVLGIVGGLVPGVTYMASTQLSYFIENKVCRFSPFRSTCAVVATGSADNAGATSSLYPLLWLGIPISLGEAMLVWLFDKHNIVLNLNLLSQPVGNYPLYMYLILCFVVVNILAYLLSWPGRKISIKFSQILYTKWVNYVILCLVVFGLYFLANEHYNPAVFYYTFALAALVGLLTKRIDWMPLIMGMILGNWIELTLFKLGVIGI